MREIVADAARFLAARATEPTTLADVADHVGYSPFHLARTFERHLGVPPGQFLAAHRFQRAKRLLLSGDERIVEICHEVGFTSVGTFTTRFAAVVGRTPLEFRRLPDTLAQSPPRPVVVPGRANAGGTVVGSVRLSAAALALLGDAPQIYVGLFPRRAARGKPVSGTLLGETTDFLLTGVPPGVYWLMSSALPSRTDPESQLVPVRTVSGVAGEPVRVTRTERSHCRDISLDIAPAWSPPVLVALPPLASDLADRAMTTVAR